MFEHPCPCQFVKNAGKTKRCSLYEVASIVDGNFHNTFGIFFGDMKTRRDAFEKFVGFKKNGTQIIRNAQRIYWGDTYDFVFYQGVYKDSTFELVEKNFNGRIIFPRVVYEGHEYLLALFRSGRDVEKFLQALPEYEYKVLEAETYYSDKHPEVLEAPITFFMFPCLQVIDPKLDLQALLNKKEHDIISTAVHDKKIFQEKVTERELRDACEEKGIEVPPKDKKADKFWWEVAMPSFGKGLQLALVFCEWMRKNPIIKKMIGEICV